MKLLVAIPSSNPEELAKTTLTWAARAGFDLRIFTDPNISPAEYAAAIDEANYQEYLDINYDTLVAKTNPLEYAQRHGYGLLVVLPSNLDAWNDNANKDNMVIDFAYDMAACRKEMGTNLKQHEITYENGARIIRVVKL